MVFQVPVVDQSSITIHPVVRKLAWAVCLVSLVPISMGALVTTLKAGMAFADWPSSDGHNMLLYPWFKDIFDNPAKFTEHGHRLAGVLIGMLSIGLAAAAWRFEKQRWVRVYAYSILGAVIAQGLLGGIRVLLDKQVLAMLHSVTGALFFCLCIGFLVFTRPAWGTLRTILERRTSIGGLAVVFVLPVVVMGQYLLGGALRHLHTLVDEHIGV
jgi:cytochrome c oxidase assembly protein subunit 15